MDSGVEVAWAACWRMWDLNQVLSGLGCRIPGLG